MPDFVRLREYIRRSGRKTALLNYLWSFMILAGLFWGMVTGSLEGVTQGLLDSAKDAVTLGLTMLGIMSFWSGILEVGNRAGVLDWLSGKMAPVLHFLFPDLPGDHPGRIFRTGPAVIRLLPNWIPAGPESGAPALPEDEAILPGQPEGLPELPGGRKHAELPPRSSGRPG